MEKLLLKWKDPRFAITTPAMKKYAEKRIADIRLSKIENEEWKRKNGDLDRAISNSPLFEFLNHKNEKPLEDDIQHLEYLMDNLS